MNPQCKVADRIQSVVYASDFSIDATQQLEIVLRLCKRLDAKLAILHHAEIIYAWSMDEESAEVQSYRKEVDKKKLLWQHNARRQKSATKL